MSRTYKGVRPKVNRVYSVSSLQELYGVCANTVSNWVRQGLKPSDGSQPYVFNGSEVKRFHEERRQRTKAQLRIGEFKCLHCKAATFPDGSTVKIQMSGSANCMIEALCLDCQKPVSKILNRTGCDKILECLNTNTTLETADEEVGQIPSGIGKDRGSPVSCTCSVNDRIIFDWMGYAGRSDPKTVDAHLYSIRDFERFHHGKLFQKVTKEGVSTFKESLKGLANADDETRLSVSTIRHRASHLKAFFEWLLKQKGFKKLDQTLPEYFLLPKKFAALALPSEKKPAPTMDQAVGMLEAMPAETMLQRRNRAMFALPFLGALRAKACTTLRVKHLDTDSRQITQNAAESCTKNGKSLRIDLFPVPLLFYEIVCAWVDELKGRGFRAEDAMFPSNRDLKHAPLTGQSRIEAMTSCSTIESAFKTASRLIGEAFNPHSAKHCIGNLGHDFCWDARDRKAWSMNMGHEDEVVTETYRVIPAEERSGIFRNFHNAPRKPPEEMELMLMYHDHELTKGTPEYARAEILVNERRRQRQKTNHDVIES